MDTYHQEQWADERGFECELRGTNEKGISVVAIRAVDGLELRLDRRNPVVAKRDIRKLIAQFLETGNQADFYKPPRVPDPPWHSARGPAARVGTKLEARNEGEVRVISNYTGYAGGANFEHDDTGGLMNYSGSEDEIFSAVADHDGWDSGYDY